MVTINSPILRPIGELVYVNEDGCLPRQGRPPTAEFQPVLDDLIAQLRDHLGRTLINISLRGSIPRGTSVAGISDVDLVVFVSKESTPITLTSNINPPLPIEMSVIMRDTFPSTPGDLWMRFALAFSGWSIWGEDILADLPEPHLTVDAMGHLPRASKWLAQWSTYWDETVDDKDRNELCQWLMKRCVRSLFESRMLRLGAYSRDIYPCAQTAIQAFPDHAAVILTAAELAVNPTSDRKQVAEVVAEISPLLLAEQARL